MARRLTRGILARRLSAGALLLWLTFIGLALVIVLVMSWHARRRRAGIDRVVSVAASADGSTVAALLGDGRLLVWDSTGTLKTTVPTHGNLGALALSSDGKMAAVSGEATVGEGPPHGGADLWDLAAGKLLRTIAPSAPASRIVFSPTEAVLALQSDTPGHWQSPVGSATEIYSIDDQGPPRTAGQNGVCLAFSRDGKMLAVVMRTGEIQVYDASSLRLTRQFGRDGGSSHRALAWGPEGKRLAVLRIGSRYKKAPKQAIEIWRIAARGLPVREAIVENDAAAPTNWKETIHYLPNGRAVVVDDGVSLKAFEAKTLKPLPPLRPVPALECGVGFRGDSFITAGVDRVDLWNAETLDEPRQLWAFETSSQPNVFPAVAGLMLCTVMLSLRHAGKGARDCQTCHRRFYRIGKKDRSFDCPGCRADAEARALAPVELAHQRRVRWRRSAGSGALLCVAMLAVATVVIFGNRFATWPLFLAGVAIVAAPTMLLRDLLLKLHYHVTTLRHVYADSAADVQLAEWVACTTGKTRHIGPMLVWSAQGTPLAETLEAEIGLAQQQIASALGRTPSVPAARTLLFPEAEGLARYLAWLEVTFDPRSMGQRLHQGSSVRRLVVAARPLREQSPGPRGTLQWLLIGELLQDAAGPRPADWLCQGLPLCLAHDDQNHELARLNRRVLAGQTAGRTIEAAEFFSATAKRNWWKHGRHGELRHFAWSRQFEAQAWSVAEFLCGRGATPPRRSAFQRFFNDPARPNNPTRAIESHFGCTCQELLFEWQRWVDEQGIGEHDPPAPHVATYLNKGPIDKIASYDTPPGERVMAIRELGQYGYLLGANRLVALLHEENQELRSEAIWSLECISGQVLSSSGDWQTWWEDVGKKVVQRAP